MRYQGIERVGIKVMKCGSGEIHFSEGEIVDIIFLR
jgi:hypothetical protein